jgi:hypothetical protein
MATSLDSNHLLPQHSHASRLSRTQMSKTYSSSTTTAATTTTTTTTNTYSKIETEKSEKKNSAATSVTNDWLSRCVASEKRREFLVTKPQLEISPIRVRSPSTSSSSTSSDDFKRAAHQRAKKNEKKEEKKPNENKNENFKKKIMLPEEYPPNTSKSKCKKLMVQINDIREVKGMDDIINKAQEKTIEQNEFKRHYDRLTNYVNSLEINKNNSCSSNSSPESTTKSNSSNILLHSSKDEKNDKNDDDDPLTEKIINAFDQYNQNIEKQRNDWKKSMSQLQPSEISEKPRRKYFYEAVDEDEQLDKQIKKLRCEQILGQ